MVRALELDLITSKGQGSNPIRGTNKFHSMDIVKLDAVQLYKYQRSIGVLGFSGSVILVSSLETRRTLEVPKKSLGSF